jgi:hypothetical protein
MSKSLSRYARTQLASRQRSPAKKSKSPSLEARAREILSELRRSRSPRRRSPRRLVGTPTTLQQLEYLLLDAAEKKTLREVREKFGDLPLTYTVLERLKQFGDEVAPYYHYTCPRGWEAYTDASLEEVEAAGAFFLNGKGNFCLPRGKGTEKYRVGYRDEQDVTPSLRTVRTNLDAILSRMEKSLETPEQQAEREARESAVKASRSASFSARKTVKQQLEKDAEDRKHEANVKRIAKIMKKKPEYAGSSDEELKTLAEAYLAEATTCADGAGNKDQCTTSGCHYSLGGNCFTETDVNAVKAKIAARKAAKETGVPITTEELETFAADEELEDWWRQFYRSRKAKKALDRAKERRDDEERLVRSELSA